MLRVPENLPHNTTQICLLPRGKAHLPADWVKGHVRDPRAAIKYLPSEYETRTVVRIRVRRIVIRIRIRHAAIRIRVVIGARQNKGMEESANILT